MNLKFIEPQPVPNLNQHYCMCDEQWNILATTSQYSVWLKNLWMDKKIVSNEDIYIKFKIT